MNNIFIISTGGTFNKIYNRINGNLEIDLNNSALKSLEQNWLTKLNYKNIINKDSLDFTQKDRETLYSEIKNCKYNKIIVIHGTDTIDISAKYIFDKQIDKTIIFTGAMVPFSINPIEATANLTLALGYAKLAKNGVYISLNGIVDRFDNIIKNRKLGKFEYKDK